MYNDGFVYQFALRVSALVFSLVSAWLAPTASYENRVTTTEVITRAIEAREEMLATGSAEAWSSVQPESNGLPWKFNSASDSVVGTLLFGTAVNKPGSRDMMLQCRLAGTAPEAGERRCAFPPDCFPRASPDGMFVIGEAGPEDEREEASQVLAREWRAREVAYTQGCRVVLWRCPFVETAVIVGW